ncbi:MAG: uroporphyrinogen decarboxylase family protein [Planctomycetota bacterium]|jgi:uroporphyrinogen-III decarboxylase
MTSKERMMTALNKGKPDRLPVTIHQWQQFYLDEYLGGVDQLEAFEMFGMDAAVQEFADFGQYWYPGSDYAGHSTSEWRDEAKIVKDDVDDFIIHHTINTPEGVLTYKTSGNRQTTWLTEYPIKHDEDINAIKYIPVPTLDPKPFNELYDKVGDKGILRGFVWDQNCPWPLANILMPAQQLIMATFDKPDWVHELLGILLAKQLRFIESMKGAKFDLVETGGGPSSSSVISPKLHEEFSLPYDRQIHDALHSLGFKTAYHTCGGTKGIEELIVTNGTDASETLPTRSIGTNQDPWEFKEVVGDRLALIGGMDQFNVLGTGSREDIRNMVFKLFKTVGYEGGYILSCCDHFYFTPPDNLRIYVEAARECIY